MRRLLSSALLVLTGACATGSPRRFTTADRTQVLEVLRAQERAWNAGDLDAFMSGYARTPELVFTSGGEVRRGYHETALRYRRRYGGDRAGMGRLAFEVVDVQAAGADGAVVLGRWRLTDTPSAGGGVFSVVLERRPEGWRIIHDHTSSSPSPRAPDGR
jgi:ketosteroid isomerase-like protein